MASIQKQLAQLGASPEMIRGALCNGKPIAEAESEAKKKPHKLDGMNKTEARYSAELDWAIREGRIRWYIFGRFCLKLAYRTTYTVDFLIQRADGSLQCVEIKGKLEDDASVKFKLAREMFPQFEWTMLRYECGAWKEVNI